MKITVKAVEGLLPEPDLSRLKADFQNYKEGLYTPNYFGRDGDFSHPLLARQEELWHLHLAESEPPTWPRWKSQYQRTSDHWLVYCPGFYNPKYYLLIAVLKHDAHNQAHNIDLMNGLAAIAEDFRQRF